MPKLLFKNLLSPILLGITAWIAGTSIVAANPTPAATGANAKENLTSSTTTDSATTVSAQATTEQIEQAKEASEIKPGDWAYQTLQSLSTKYGCGNVSAGNKTLSREEFATSLNGCIQSVEELVARRKPRRQIKKRRPAAPAVVTPPPAPEVTSPPPTVEAAPPAPTEPAVTQQDLDQIKQLVQSFNTELQAVDARIKAIDDKVATIQKQSFSTTTKLVGEAIFAVTGLAGGPSTATRSTIFSDRVRLNFRSSFTGKDLLLVRLQSRNSASFAGAASGTNQARLGFEGNDENLTTLHRLQYQLPLADTSKVFIEAVGSEFNDNYYTFNPEHQSAGLGSVSRFGRFNPIYRLSNEGAGIGIDHKFSPNLGLVVSYAVPRVAIPGAIPGTTAPETVNSPGSVAANAGVGNSNGGGLFGGSNVIFSQLTLKPSEDVSLGLLYARSYHSAGTGVSGNNGSNFANNPFNSSATATTPTSANHYSLAGSFNLTKDLILSAWGGLTQARQEGGAGATADIWNYAATLAVKDFGSKGSTLGFVVGLQPKVTSNSLPVAAGAPARTNRESLHLEAFYKYKVSDNLSITPGIIVLTNPTENNTSNVPAEYLGTIRTTFSF